jgi:recombination protein RecT
MSGPQTDTSGRIRTSTNGGGAPGSAVATQPKEQQERKTLLQMLMGQNMQAQIAKALPKHVTPDRIVRIVTTALNTTKDLAQCTPESFFGCVMQAAQLGLEVNTPLGHAYLIPRRIKGVLTCTLIIGYQGQIDLALRSDKVVKIWTRTVHEGDEFEVHYGLTENIIHKPSKQAGRLARPLEWVYCVAELSNGAKVFEVLSAEEVESRRARGGGAGDSFSPWRTDYDAMARKSSVRALFKWLPKTSEMALVESMEERAESNRNPVFSESVNDSLRGAGFNPILDTEGEDTTPLDLPQIQHDADGVVIPREGQA